MATEQQEMSQQKAPYILVANSKDGDDTITVKDLTVKTPGKNGVTLVEHVDLTFNKGDRVLMTGKSGSGKTTVAKSLLSKWDQGTGVITMPEGMKVMGMAQKAYFPDVTLRSVMNLLPEGEAQFADEELTEALQTVGLDRLIQHIPGQQVKLMMDDLLGDIKQLLAPIASQDITDQKLEALRHGIMAKIVSRVEEQFNTVQYTPDSQREYFKEQFTQMVNELMQQNRLPKKQLNKLIDETIDNIDIELARPLTQALTGLMKNTVKSKRAIFAAYTPGEIKAMGNIMQKQMSKKLALYMANKDTDDHNREIRINKTQADYLAKTMATKLEDMIKADNTSAAYRFINKSAVQPIAKLFNAIGKGLPNIMPEAIKKPLSNTFNASASMTGWLVQKALWIPKKTLQAATFATTRLSVFSRTKNMADQMTQATNFFMQRQIVRGDELANSGRLSGGQKQMLMIATVLLHKPDVLILDEITASLDSDSAAELYEKMMDVLPEDTTVISIAHHYDMIYKHHSHHAKLEDHAITLEAIDHNAPQATGQQPAPPTQSGPSL